MILNLAIVCACLSFIASANGWIFRTSSCNVSPWPSDWEYPSTNPLISPAYDTQIYSCDVTVEQSGNLTSVVDVVGTHIAGKNNSDVQRIRINNSTTFTSMPSNIGNLLPSLIAIDFRATLIENVTAEDFRQFPKLTYLALSVGLISSFDSDLLKYTPHLQAFVVPSNKIVNVGQDLLANLPDLKFVNFLSNPCISYCALNPQEVEWLKSNLTLRCAPIATTTPTPNCPTVTATPIPTPSTVSTTTPIPTPTVTTPAPKEPTEDCEIRCSLQEETDLLRNALIEQGALIRDLFKFVSDHSHRIVELETFNSNISTAMRVFLGKNQCC